MLKKRLPISLLALSMFTTLGSVGAQAQEVTPPIDCGPGDGRDDLTTSGFKFEFDAPATGGNSAASNADETGTVWANRSATFPFNANLAPSAGGKLKATLSWANNPHDYDLYIVDDESGGVIASSENFNQTDPTGEQVTDVEIAHCQDISVLVRNWVAGPTERLSLAVEIAPGEQLLACAENDPAPGCSGKAAGEAPDFVADTRSRLYMGGDRPGMVAATARYAASVAGTEAPMAQKLVAARPTSGVPNSHTRPVVGNPDFGEYNNFFPFFRMKLPQPVTFSGPVTMLAWVSSRTMNPTDKLWFDLHLDGALVKRVEVIGKATRGPKPVLVTFEGYDATEALESLTVGITSPRGNDDPPNQASYAEWTLFYDSVQYQSRVTLPFALPASS
jgi:hypothetical protein